jgi:hypothetical protein
VIMSDSDSPEKSGSSSHQGDNVSDHRVTLSHDGKNELGTSTRTDPPAERGGVEGLTSKAREGLIGPKLKKRGLNNDERALTRANIEAIQNEKRAGLTNEEIQKLTGFSLGAISKHTRNIKVDPAVESTKKDDEDARDEPPPPMIVDLDNERLRYQDRPYHVEDSRYGSYPPIRNDRLGPPRREMLVDGDWERARLLLLGDALKLGATDPTTYIRDIVLPDLQLARKWKEWMPGETNEQKDRSFQHMTEWGLRYLKLRDQIRSSESNSDSNQ